MWRCHGIKWLLSMKHAEPRFDNGHNRPRPASLTEGGQLELLFSERTYLDGKHSRRDSAYYECDLLRTYRRDCLKTNGFIT